MNAVIYDCEIIRAIPDPYELPQPEIKYCAGWEDHANMGIACICAYDLLEGCPRVFLADNFNEFQHLVNDRRDVIGFNSVGFDDKLCAANGLQVKTTYDLLREVRLATGQPADYVKGVTRSGYKLQDLAVANLGRSKSGHGELAPILWQQGKFGAVIDYCARDVELTRVLFERRLGLIDPNRPNGRRIVLRLLEQEQAGAA